MRMHLHYRCVSKKMASGSSSSSKTVCFVEEIIDEPTQHYDREELRDDEGDFVESSSEGESISSDDENEMLH